MKKQNAKRERTIKRMMMKSGIAFCLIPFFVLWISFAISSTSALKKNIESEQKTIVRLFNSSVENYFYELEEAMSKVTYDAEVKHILKNVDRKEYNSTLYNAYQYILKIIGKTCFSFSGVENIIITDINGDFYSTSHVDEKLQQFVKDTDVMIQEVKEHQGKTWITSLKIEGKEKLLVVKPIMDLQEIKHIGMMYMVLQQEELETLLEQAGGTKKAVLLVDQKGKKVFSKNEQILEEKDAVITQSESNNYGMCVVTGVCISQYSQKLLSRQFSMFLVFVGVTILLFILIQYIYRNINKEFAKLLHPGKEKIEDETTYFEIRQLNHEMMSLIQKNNEGEKKIVRLMNHCDTVNLDKLQAQINPHFLYNTLTSIKYIAMENEQKQISELITALIKVLRSTINRDGAFLPLGREVENVKNYMRIQNVIYKDHVKFEVQIPEELNSVQVPNFILQPLVENCLFHGIHPEEKGGEICIAASMKEEGLSITVSDNGDGFSEDCLLNMMGAENNKEMMTNFGLKGVQQKIQLMCGEDSGLFIKSTKNQGSTVEIIISIHSQKGET